MSNMDLRPGPARIRLFGRFGLIAPGGVDVLVTSRRGRGLIAYLFLAPDHEESRARLRGHLWGDRAEPQARASLRQCLLELREVLARLGLELADVGRDGIAMRGLTVRSDLDDLLGGISDDDPRVGAAQLALVGQRRLLEDLDLPGAFGAWIDQARPRVERSIANKVHAQLERFERAGRWEDVRVLGEAFARRDPLDEDVAAAVIRAAGATGDGAAARRRFGILQDAMHRAFGASPGAKAHEALAAAERPQAVTAPPPARSRDLQVADRPTPPLVVIASFETGDAVDGAPRAVATLRDEVVAALSRFHDLRVLVDPRPLGLVNLTPTADPEAAYVLGASLRAGRHGARLTLRLVRGGDLSLIWTGGLETAGLDVADTIDGIIAWVVGSVAPRIESDVLRNASRRPSPSIYERYLLARDAAARARTHYQARIAAQALEGLIQSKPSFALAYPPLATLYDTDFCYTRASSSTPGLKERALALGKTAVSLDRGHADGYAICGWAYLRRKQWDIARLYFESAFSLNPLHPRHVMELVRAFLLLDEKEHARKILDQNRLVGRDRDDPYHTQLGLVLFIEGDLALSASCLEQIVKPDIWGLMYRAMTARAAGLDSEAKIGAVIERLRAIWPPDAPMTNGDVVAWVSTHHPLRSPEAEARFLVALRDILPSA